MTELENKEILHEIELGRVQNGIVKKCLIELEKANRLIRSELRKTDGVYTKARYKELRAYLKEVAKELKKNLDLDISAEEFIDYELEAQIKLYKKYGKVQLVAPNKEQLYTTATFTPYTASSSFENYLDSFEYDYFNMWDSAIRTGYLTGQTTPQIVKRVMGYSARDSQVADMGQIHALRVSIERNTRTALQSFAMETHRMMYEKNEDLFAGYRWYSTLDRKTCIICGNMESKTYKTMKDFGDIPPLHFNCVTGNTLISTASPISRIYRRAYKGSIYVIHTSSGNVLTVTPNHPILTDSGFVGAKFLNVGDNIICDNGFERINIGSENENKMETTAENLFSSFWKSSKVTSCTVPLTTEDFHTDIPDNEVDIVSINGKLSNEVDVITFKNFGKSCFINGKARCNIKLFSKSKLVKFFVSFLSTFSRFMCIFCKMFNLFWSRISHSCVLLLARISHRNIISSKKSNHRSTTYTEIFCNTCNSDSFFVKFKNFINRNRIKTMFSSSINIGSMENISDDVFGNTVLARNILDRNSALIKRDSIIAIDIVQKSCHIYNLETVDNFYFTNNIISHNCRCVILPIVKGMEELDDSTRASMNGQVSNKITFEDWLEKQPADVQIDVLGETRYKLFKEGKSLGGFIADNRVIPLEKL